MFGFLKNNDEPYVYKTVSGSIVSNDILMIGNDILTLESIKAWLGNYFLMKDIAEASFGSIEVIHGNFLG